MTAETVLVTGFPDYTGRRLVQRILTDDPQAQVWLLVKRQMRMAAERFIAAQGPDARRVRLLGGDVVDMDLGLAGDEIAEVVERVSTLHHLAHVRPPGQREEATRVHVAGTRAVLELAGECRNLRRLCHWSTAFVSGKRKGVVLEEDLDDGHGFFDPWQATRFEAERLARDAARRLPVTIFRPGVVVGDSVTGEVDDVQGSYGWISLFLGSPVAVPRLGRGTAPMHLVPVDFVVDAGYRLSHDERAAGVTFHLTDPNPLPARTVQELVADRAERGQARVIIPRGVARAVMRTPGLEKMTRAPRTFLESLDQLTFYNSRNTVRLLEGTGIACPTFDTYVDRLVRWVREDRSSRRARSGAEGPADAGEGAPVYDPFE